MIKLFLSGCCGRMGRVIAGIVADRDDCTVVGGYDLKADPALSFPVFTDVEKVDVDYDVLIDFSNASAVPSVIRLSQRTHRPLVVATTGLSSEVRDQLTELSKETAVFTSANMSLGVNILIRLAKQATKALFPSFNIEIIEAHHNQKLDAPSGTALMIADAIKENLNDPEVFYRYERESIREKRSDKEIGISAIRGGTIVGEHDVILAGPNEVITLSHSAQSREVFANGAVAAALFLSKQENGMYDMDDLISQSIGQ